MLRALRSHVPCLDWNLSRRGTRDGERNIKTRPLPAGNDLVEVAWRQAHALREGPLRLACSRKICSKLFHGAKFAQCEQSVKPPSSLCAIFFIHHLLSVFAV